MARKDEERKAKEELPKRRKEAEDYILSSGDPEAIKLLMLARAIPANYCQILEGGMKKGNPTLKTALGVMAGVVAGDLIATAISFAAIQSALDGIQAEVNNFDIGIEPIDTSSFADAGLFDNIDL